MFKVQRRSTGVRRVSRESDLAGITWLGGDTWYIWRRRLQVNVSTRAVY